MDSGSNKALAAFVDEMSMRLYGLTQTEAQARGICLQCKQEALPRCYSHAGREEYRISGLCEHCFDALSGDEGEVIDTTAEPTTLRIEREGWI